MPPRVEYRFTKIIAFPGKKLFRVQHQNPILLNDADLLYCAISHERYDKGAGRPIDGGGGSDSDRK